MKSLALALLGALLAAGCLSPSGVVGNLPEADALPASMLPPAPEEPQFCDSASDCTFWDEDYHEYVLYNVDTYVFDVLIVPSASIDSSRDTASARAAVQAWEDGGRALGAAWFRDNFTINVYVLGQDNVPPEALADPEIVVLLSEHNPFLLFGVGLEPKQFGCQLFGQESVHDYAVHRHEGVEIIASDCTGIGFTCFAVNTSFLLGSSVWMQDLVAHEVGHCLGVGHVGDALDFSAKRVPVQDIMSYQHHDTQVHCVSNLNVRVLEALYAPLLGQTVSQPVSAGDYYTMAKTAYTHVNC